MTQFIVAYDGSEDEVIITELDRHDNIDNYWWLLDKKFDSFDIAGEAAVRVLKLIPEHMRYESTAVFVYRCRRLLVNE